MTHSTNRHEQTSIILSTIGAAVMFIFSTRGIDVGGRPSVFFFELTIAKIVLTTLWNIMHLLMAVVESTDDSTQAHNLLLANSLIDGLHAAVHIAQLVYHRYWYVCVVSCF